MQGAWGTIEKVGSVRAYADGEAMLNSARFPSRVLITMRLQSRVMCSKQRILNAPLKRPTALSPWEILKPCRDLSVELQAISLG